MKLAKPLVFWALIVFIAETQHVHAQMSMKEVIDLTSPAIVEVSSYDKNGNSLSYGSGFIVHQNGLIVSNYHVVKGAHTVTVKTKDSDVYSVRGVVDFDAHRDFVILRIAAYDLPLVELGNSSTAESGDPIIAIGNPLGLSYTVSDGIVSGTRAVEGYALIQHTAPISPGNSGGPLVNMSGHVIGINTSTLREGQNLNFALPINYVRGVLELNTSIRHNLSDIADNEAEQEAIILAQRIDELYAPYQDPDGYFSVVYPRAWKVERTSGWNTDKTVFSILTMMAPEEAHQAKVDEYLSEGIRFTLEMPPRGEAWVDSVDEWAKQHTDKLLEGNPGFVVTDIRSNAFEGIPAQIYEFVGQNEEIPEPEKDTLIFLSKSAYRLVIEFVSPTSKLQSYEELYSALVNTLELSP